MKNFLLTILFFTSGFLSSLAQEIDTIPISTKNLDIRLKRSPLPSRMGVLQFKPIEIKPAIIDAKVNYWKTKTSIGVNVNQAAFSDNWKNGGVNSLAIGGLVNYKGNFTIW
jgi:hypothetical protein